MSYTRAPATTEFMLIFRGSGEDVRGLREAVVRGDSRLGGPRELELYNGSGLASKDGPYLLMVSYEIDSRMEDSYKSRLSSLVTDRGMKLERAGILVPL